MSTIAAVMSTARTRRNVYFDVSVREGEVVLRPAVVSASGERVKAVRNKMRALGLSEKDVDDAITWASRRRR